MGGAQPLAAVLAGASCIVVECQRVANRHATGNALPRPPGVRYRCGADDAGRREARPAPDLDRDPRQRRRVAAAVAGTRHPARRRHRPDQRARPRQWLPAGRLERRRWLAARASGDPRSMRQSPRERSRQPRTSRRCSAGMRKGVPVIDYGNNLRQVALDAGVANAFDYPGFVPACIRPLFCAGKGPFRWVALSGDPEDIYRTDAQVKALFPEDPQLHRWLDLARDRIAFQGLPARICWLGLGQRASRRARVQRDGRARRVEGADRHRPRSSRQRLGRVPQPRDRGDAATAAMPWPTGRCSTRC